MQFIRFLVSFIVSAEYFITFTHSSPCEGLFCHEVNSPQSNLSSYINLFRSNLTSENPGKTVNKISFNGIIKSNKLNNNCCYNGGRCFLEMFCLCPLQYTGRQCEYEKWPLDCAGGILNGHWVVRGCSLCRCFSGELHCLKPPAECEQEQEQEATTSVGTKLNHCSVNLLGFSLLFFVMLF